MIRLLMVVLVVALSVYILVFKGGQEQDKPEIIYQDALDRAESVEQQLQEAAEKQRRDIDRLSQ